MYLKNLQYIKNRRIEMAIRELQVGEEISIPKEGKLAIMFHLPGHCAGCKVALSNLQNKELKDVTVVLVNADEETFRPLITEYNATTAPTIIVYENGEIIGEMRGLKDFLQNHKRLIGD